jgi:hypothetical protein
MTRRARITPSLATAGSAVLLLLTADASSTTTVDPDTGNNSATVCARVN